MPENCLGRVVVGAYSRGYLEKKRIEELFFVIMISCEMIKQYLQYIYDQLVLYHTYHFDFIFKENSYMK